ncbi:type VI secretion system baseplate subunit TssE [Thaumasiovibrio sp. DFM-14]|uniref:type VI secretion system baseplate subunit TssE n=1 Tax=Thaumasiovibrio sp. DFM-14 TaxID=3384792 RepID=UPI0039A29548
MDKGYRLLERIERGEPKSSYDKVISHDLLIESIHSHLRDLLNTHAGNAMIAEEYGLPDFNDVLSEKSNLVHEVRISIKRCVERYEPRLSNVSVTYTENPDDILLLRFAVSGVVRHNNEELSLNINVAVDVDGQFEV